MNTRWAVALALVAGGPLIAQAGPVRAEVRQEVRPVMRPERPDVPSGQVLALFEVIREEGMQRWRFLAPGVRGYEIDAVLDDMQALCDGFVIPRLEDGALGDEIVLNLMDRPVPFGQTDPDARQHFEAYRVENGACIWEVF